MMINNVVLLFAATNEETPYEQLLLFPRIETRTFQGPVSGSPDNQRARKAVVVYVQDKDRLFTVPYFFVRSFRYTASYRHGYLDFHMYRALGIIARGGGGGGGGEKKRKNFFSLPSKPPQPPK